MGTWELPNTQHRALRLKKLMEKPLLMRQNPQRELYDIFGDDDLYDELDRYLDSPDYDVRFLVKMHVNYYLNDYSEHPKNYTVKLSEKARVILESIIAE